MLEETKIHQYSIDSIWKELLSMEEKSKASSSKGLIMSVTKKIHGELSFKSQVGLIHDYYGRDSSNILNRNSVSGLISYQMEKLNANLSFGVMDLKNDFGQSNYFTLNFAPKFKKPEIELGRPEKPSLKEPQIQGLDSLKQLVDNKKMNLDSEKRKLLLQIKELNRITDQLSSKLNSTLFSDSLDKLKNLIESSEEKFDQTSSFLSDLQVISEKISKLQGIESDLNHKKLDLNKSLADRISRLTIGRGSVDGFAYNGSSLPINGLGFGLDFEKWYMDHSSGVVQSLNLNYNDPLAEIQSSLNSSNLLTVLLPSTNQIMSSTKIGSGKRDGNTLYVESSLMKSVVDNGFLLSNLAGLNRKFKKLKGLQANLDVGLIESSDTELTAATEEKLFYSLGVDYSIRRTGSSFIFDYKSVGKSAGIDLAGNAVSDFRSVNFSYNQKVTKRVNVTYKTVFANLDKSKDKYLRSNSTMNNVVLNASIFDGLSVNGVYSIGNFSYGLKQKDRNSVESFSFGSTYQYELKERKLNSQVNAVKSESFNFQYLFELNLFTIQQSIELAEGEITLYAVDQQMIRDGEEVMNSIIFSSAFSRRFNKAQLIIRVDFSKERISNSNDFGGKLQFESNLPFGMVADVFIEKHVNGSYLTVLYPERFAKSPFELSLGLKKIF